jgi:ADP-dependent NAD(P)H-hydrate dehydratase / NAD(P)H-hydrate epimerase
MKILTAEQMREADRRTIEAGIPGLILMENAGCRVVEFLEKTIGDLAAQRVVVVCGKGNNGGDGLVIARQLRTRFKPHSLRILLAAPPEEFRGDAATNWSMVQALGIPSSLVVEPAMRRATLVVDALLGTGLRGPAEGRALELIHEMNSGFPLAAIVSVDVPSGLHAEGKSVQAGYTVTLAAPKIELILPPTCDRAGSITVAPIGIPREFIEDESAHWLNLVEPGMFARLFLPRERGAHKGSFGHVLVLGGAQGKGGAAAMSGAAALRSGAGLVTVATDPRERATVTTLMPELMTSDWADGVGERDVLALGPGLGREPEAEALAVDLFANAPVPAVVDADALNALATTTLNASGQLRVLTPHPGEMSRLCGCGVVAVQDDRVGTARRFATERACVVVLKGQRTVIALPDGRVYINPTGTPAMATAGSGDILTGLIAGLLAQFPQDAVYAVLAAVWLHGRSGELGAHELGEQSLTAMDLLRFLPSAMRELRP